MINKNISHGTTNWNFKDKQCIECHKYFRPLAGKQVSCSKNCSNIRRKKRYLENYDPIRNREYKIKNKGRTNKWQRDDYKKNPEKYHQWSKRYRLSKSDEIRKKQKEYYNKNKEKCKEASKKWVRDNRQRWIDYQREWFRERRIKINRERNILGLPRLGDGNSKETTLYLLLKEIFNRYKIYRNARWVFDGRLELDIYLPELNLAFEYQGKQHFNEKVMKIISRGSTTLAQQQERDERKRKLCKINGINLIYVKYYEEITLSNILKKLDGGYYGKLIC